MSMLIRASTNLQASVSLLGEPDIEFLQQDLRFFAKETIKQLKAQTERSVDVARGRPQGIASSFSHLYGLLTLCAGL